MTQTYDIVFKYHNLLLAGNHFILIGIGPETSGRNNSFSNKFTDTLMIKYISDRNSAEAELKFRYSGLKKLAGLSITNNLFCLIITNIISVFDIAFGVINDPEILKQRSRTI